MAVIPLPEEIIDVLATDNGGTTGYASLATRLEAARRQNFVGRQAELALFRETLIADPPPYFVLYCRTCTSGEAARDAARDSRRQV